jgi:translation initiation factor eIF-2B subunit epsilon
VIRAAKQKIDDLWESAQLKRELIWEEEVEDELTDDEGSVANSDDFEHTTISHSTLPSSSRVSSDDAAQEIRFATEAFDTLRRGREEKLDVDSINLEMSSLRMSTNVRMDVYVKVIFLALFDFLPYSASSDEKDQWSQRRAECAQPSKKTLSSLMSNLKYWSPLLQKVVGSVSEFAVKEQVSLLKSLESACSWKDGVYRGLFGKTVQFLYDPLEIISEEAVELWEKDIEQSDASGRQQWLVLTEAFRNWLKEAEEEDDEEDDDD